MTLAEYFRDDQGQDVLLFIDNIFRLPKAGSEVFCFAGTEAVCCWLFSQPWLRKWGHCKNGLRPHVKGLSLLFHSNLCTADDLTDPAPATAFAHLDATTVLSRAIVEIGILPSCRPVGFFVPNSLNRWCLGEETLFSCSKCSANSTKI